MEIPDQKRVSDKILRALDFLFHNLEAVESEIKSAFPLAEVVITGPLIRAAWWGEIIEPRVVFSSNTTPEVFLHNVDPRELLSRQWRSFQVTPSGLQGSMLYFDIIFVSQERGIVAGLIPEEGSFHMASTHISILRADCIGLVPSTRSLIDFGGAGDLLNGRLTIAHNSIVRLDHSHAFEFFFIASQIRGIISEESLQLISDVFDHAPLTPGLRSEIGTWIGRILKFSLTPSLGIDLIRVCKLRYRLFPMLTEFAPTERASRWRMMMQLVDRAATYIRINKIDDVELCESILYTCLVEPLWKQDFSYLSQLIKSKSKVTNFLLSVQSSSGLKWSEADRIRDGVLYIRLIKSLLFKANLLTREFTPSRISRPKSLEKARVGLDRSLMMSSGIVQGQEWIVKSRGSIQDLFPHLEECFGFSDIMKGEFLSLENL
jgi:hypothetical protein